MNKKLTVRRSDGALCYCVLSGDCSLEDQVREMYASDGPDFGAVLYGDRIEIVDFIAWECRARLPVVDLSDTDLPVNLQWVSVER